MQELMETPRRFAFEPFDDLYRALNPISASPSLFSLYPSTSLAPNAASALLNAPTATSFLNTAAARTARMDIVEKGDHFEVQVELPGVDKKDISVHIDGNRLYVQATKEEKREEKDERGRFHLSERHFGAIRRSVELPGSVNAENVRASTNAGVLNIWIGKKADAEPGRIVPVQ